MDQISRLNHHYELILTKKHGVEHIIPQHRFGNTTTSPEALGGGHGENLFVKLCSGFCYAATAPGL